MTAKKGNTPAKKRVGRKSKRTRLTAQEEAFCAHYALHKVGSDAVRHAWPEWKNKDNQATAVKASKLLMRDKIKERIEVLATRAVEVVEKKFEVTVERIAEELAGIAFYKADDYFEWGTENVPLYTKKGEPILDKDGNHVHEPVPRLRIKDSKTLTPAQMKAVLSASMTISKTGDPVLEVKMGDKVSALKALGQHLGMFKMIAEAQGKGGGPIQIVVSNAEANL